MASGNCERESLTESYATIGHGLGASAQMANRLQDFQPFATYTRSATAYGGRMDDPTYKRLFAFPRMVEDLLRALVRAEWILEIDFATLRKLPAEYVGDEGQQRRGDAVWRVRFRGRWLYLLILLEFQSSNDPRMALRMLEYTALLYRELDRQGQLAAPGGWPPVLPVVLYNGDAPWTAALEMRDLIARVPAPLGACQPAQRSLLLDEQRVAVDDLPLRNLMRAVVGFEQSRTPTDLAGAVDALRGLLREPGDSELGRAFASWVLRMANRMGGGDATPLAGTLEEARMSLVERVAQWPEQWRQEGRQEGRREGLAQGFARQRILLVRLAALRFGSNVADRVAELLTGIADQESLDAAAELISSAETGAELTSGLGAIGRQGR